MITGCSADLPAGGNVA